MSAALELAVYAHERVERAQRSLNTRKDELEQRLSQLPREELGEFIRRTEPKE